MNYVFGPVPSRRLGRSLGIDMVPMKTCTMSCRYCQIGDTPETSTARKSWVPIEKAIAELRNRLTQSPRPDWITFSGSGEPTLNSDLGYAIATVKNMTDIPICVITNGSLLWMPEVRDSLALADAVLPSLDSAVEETFREICRPHADLTVEKIIGGLEAFRESFTGAIWLEILFMDGYNDSDEEIDALVRAVERIRPNSIHLNTVVRPPADTTVLPVSPGRLEEIRERFGSTAEIIASFRKKSETVLHAVTDDVREYLKRRPGSADTITMALGAKQSDIENILTELCEIGEIRSIEYHGKHYWEYIRS